MTYFEEGFNRMREEKNKQPRLSVLQLLLVAFICFKVLDLIDWSWWLVFTPLYVAVVLETVAGVLWAIALWLKDKQP